VLGLVLGLGSGLGLGLGIRYLEISFPLTLVSMLVGTACHLLL